ncbi:ATP-dependent RNA helicase FAL1 [Cyclospora cayetanensis]|uniref:RNA helicase n=1 Tax=Cyclospora cayetanensis TaxID=88456 RepID=A0A6P6RR05_9EIME|nr:ATP-dependent RNA helicase FAL1 [Cyclospora cayetanensis]
MPVTSEEAARLLESLKAGGASLEQLQGLLESLKVNLPAGSSSSNPSRSGNQGAAGAGVADGATEEVAHEDEEDDASSSLAASALAPSNAVPVSDMGRNTVNSQLAASAEASSSDAAAAGRAHLDRVDGGSHLLIQRAEPDASPLVSAKSWTDLKLSKELLLAVEALGFKAPSKIQAAALPLVLNHRENLIAQAQNGSGKTATFALSMLFCANPDIPQPQALCLCPTRELAQQTVFVLKSLARFTRLQIFLAVPQSRPADESSLFSPNAEGREVVFSSNTSPDVRQQIVVGTPGKSMELLKKRRFPASMVRMFVLDEADELINFANNMAPQVQQIRRFLPNDLQILLFSATYSDTVRQFAEKLIPRANKITLKREELTLSCIQQFYMVADPRLPPPEAPGGPPGGDPLEELVMRVFKHKYEHLKTLYGALAVGQSVIFVNSRRLAFFLALKLQKELSFSVSLICGSQAQGPEKLSIEIRDRIMKEFRRGETKVLICTDVLSRGIDVPQVTLVVNFDLPIYYTGRGRGPQPDVAGGPGVPFGGPPGFEESWEGQHVDRRGQRIVPSGIDFPDGVCVNFETYLHRIGRTGRFGLRGIAVNLVCPEEMFLLDQIRSFYKCRIDELSSDTEAIEAIIRNLRTEG